MDRHLYEHNSSRKRRVEISQVEGLRYEEHSSVRPPTKRHRGNDKVFITSDDIVTRSFHPEAINLVSRGTDSEMELGKCSVKLQRSCKAKRIDAFGNTHAMMTRRKSVIAACRAVLETAELLENIMIHLDLEVIVNAASKVNRTWRNLIFSSPMMRAKLFYFHAPEKMPDDLSGDWVFDIKTRVWAPMKGIEGSNPQIQTIMGWQKRQRAVRPAVLNPLMFRTNSLKARPSLTDMSTTCEDIYFKLQPNLQKLAAGFESEFLCNNYFGRMLVCQPPVKSIEFYAVWEEESIEVMKSPDDPGPFTLSCCERLKVHNEDGVTVRDIAEGLLKYAGKEAGVNKIRLLLSRGKKLSRIWMPGAVLVSEVEKRRFEKEARLYCEKLKSVKRVGALEVKRL